MGFINVLFKFLLALKHTRDLSEEAMNFQFMYHWTIFHSIEFIVKENFSHSSLMFHGEFALNHFLCDLFQRLMIFAIERMISNLEFINAMISNCL